MRQSGQIGHRKNTARGKVIFLHGNGCSDYPDCLTCPKPDCNWDSSNNRKKEEK